LGLRCQEQIEPFLEVGDFMTRAIVTRIEHQGLTGLGKRKFPILFDFDAVVRLPGVLRHLRKRYAQREVSVRPVWIPYDQEAGEGVHSLGRPPGIMDLARPAL
jgi:hypothetical protein